MWRFKFITINIILTLFSWVWTFEKHGADSDMASVSLHKFMRIRLWFFDLGFSLLSMAFANPRPWDKFLVNFEASSYSTRLWPLRNQNIGRSSLKFVPPTVIRFKERTLLTFSLKYSKWDNFGLSIEILVLFVFISNLSFLLYQSRLANAAVFFSSARALSIRIKAEKQHRKESALPSKPWFCLTNVRCSWFC